jgi:hypothetical protein
MHLRWCRGNLTVTSHEIAATKNPRLKAGIPPYAENQLLLTHGQFALITIPARSIILKRSVRSLCWAVTAKWPARLG